MVAAVAWPQVQKFLMYQRRDFMSTWAACVGMPRRYVDVVSPRDEATEISQGTSLQSGVHQPEHWVGHAVNSNHNFENNLNTFTSFGELSITICVFDSLSDGSPSQASTALTWSQIRENTTSVFLLPQFHATFTWFTFIADHGC